jgi:hypothetical protein
VKRYRCVDYREIYNWSSLKFNYQIHPSWNTFRHSIPTHEQRAQIIKNQNSKRLSILAIETDTDLEHMAGLECTGETYNKQVS